MKNRVSYPGYGENGQTIVAERARRSDASELASEILRITGETYLAELVGRQHVRDIGGRFLTAASVQQQYVQSPEAVEKYLKRDEALRQRGAELVVVRDAADRSKLIGYSRIAPAPEMTRNAQGGHDYEGWYVNNLVVDPEYGRKGFGSLLFHGALAIVEAHADEPLVLDAINGNDAVNAWYRDGLGFVPDLATPTGNLRFGPQLVGETYYVAPTSGDVTLGLVSGRPALAAMIPS